MYDAMREKERDEKLEVRLKSVEQKLDGVGKTVSELKGSMDMLLSIIRKSGV